LGLAVVIDMQTAVEVVFISKSLSENVSGV